MPGGLTFASGSALLKPNVLNEISDVVFRATPLINAFNAFGRFDKKEQPSPFKRDVITAGNGAGGDYTEEQAITSFGNQTYKQISTPAFWVYTPVKITSHMRAASETGGTYGGSTMQIEQEKAFLDLLKLGEDRLVGSTTDVGIRSLVDSTGDNAGLNPSTTTVWKSAELAMTASLIGTMDTMWTTLQTSPYVTNLQEVAIFASPAVVKIYADQRADQMRGLFSDGGLDYGLLGKVPEYNGRPIVAVAGLADTEMLFVDMSRVQLKTHQDVNIRELAADNLDDKWVVYMALGLQTDARNAHGKITGIS